MERSVKIAGVTYTSVPYVLIPTTKGDNAKFIETSDATATASDILSGKTAYINGEKITGTGTSGGGGGGAEVATLTLNVIAPIAFIWYTDENGEWVEKQILTSGENTIQMIKGSVFFTCENTTEMPLTNVSSGITKLNTQLKRQQAIYLYQDNNPYSCYMYATTETAVSATLQSND